MIDLYTATTPNGWKASIVLEELELDYHVNALNLGELEQKQDWYRKICPNGRIPAIVDHDNNDIAVFESGAILLYLAERCGKLLPSNDDKRAVVMQWLMLQVGGVGPMQGQLLVFTRNAPERIPFAIERYQNETTRLYGVLDERLASAEFLAGEYSIADIAHWPWIAAAGWSGIELSAYPNLSRWYDEIALRPAVQRGRDVPEKIDFEALMRDQEKIDEIETMGRKMMET